MIKKIISNTILFIVILLFISAFKSVFGNANTLVGVTTLVLTLVLMSQDLTDYPIKHFIILVVINLLLGIFALWANNNIFIGLILNFLVLASIGYFLSYNLTKSIIVPFGLQYLFMLYTPVSGIDLSKRLAALAVAPVIVMIVQFVIHSKKSKEMDIKVEESDVLEYEDEKQKRFKEINILGAKKRVDVIRLSYAIRVGILTAITGFIEALLIRYFNLYEGRWMVFTIFSLTEFYSQNCRVKSRQRLQGTIIGSIIVIVLFIFIKSNTLRGLIILAAGYLNPFVSNYRDVMIIVTISAVASVALTSGALIVAVERIGFVIVGIILALIGNKYIPEPTIN